MRLLVSISIILSSSVPFLNQNTNRAYAKPVAGWNAHSYKLVESADGSATGAPRVANGKIAFVSTRNQGATDLYVMNPDGSGLVKISANPPRNYEEVSDDPYASSPSWSPDGARLTFASGFNNDRDIYVVNPDGSGLKRLTTRNSSESCFSWYNDRPMWSPDGTKIAFVSGNIVTAAGSVFAVSDSSAQSACNQSLNIYVMNADGSDRKRLTDDTADSNDPAWTPDGTEIVFTRANGNSPTVSVMKADGSNVRKFMLDSGESVKPVWSRDGSKIAFGRSANGIPAIWEADADGSNQRRVTDGQTYSIQPAWSPDGTKLVFTKVLPNFNDGFINNPEVYIINADGSNETRLTDNPARDLNPAWQPVLLNHAPPTLTGNQVTITTWTLVGRTFAHVKLTLPDAGFWLATPGSPVRTGSDVSADARVEHLANPPVQSVTTTAQIYDLGSLADGSYTFTFKNSGVVVKSQGFTVSSAAPPPNPIDDARQFVKQQYRDFLNREADQEGEDFWTDNITKCMDPARRPAGQTEAQCTLRQRETTGGAFILSPEFQFTGYFVYRMYQGALGRQPKLSEFLPDAQFVGNGIVVSGQLSAAKINQNRTDFAAEFVNCIDTTKYRCSEFKATYDGLSNQQYVDKLFETTGVNASLSDRTALVSGLEAGTETRASVLQKVVDGAVVLGAGHQQFTTTYGQVFYEKQFTRAFVQLEYFGYMKRDPDEAGYAFWLAKLNQFGGDFVAAEMVLAFISSPEYRARFGQP